MAGSVVQPLMEMERSAGDGVERKSLLSAIEVK